MGQQLSNISVKVADTTTLEETEFNDDTIVRRSGDENIYIFSWIKTHDDMTTSSVVFDQMANTHMQLMKQIQKDLSLLTEKADKINSDVNTILMAEVFPLISARSKDVIQEILTVLTKQEQITLNMHLKQKLEDNENVDEFISSESFADTLSEGKDSSTSDDTHESKANEQELEEDKFHAQQISYFSLQSLTSLLMILIKSAEKNDPTLVQELLTLSIQLCDQLPINSFKSSELLPIIDNHWFKSLEPLTNYIHELSLSKNVMLANRAMKILLSLSIAKASFKDILPILKRLIFNKVHVFNVQRLFIRLNHILIKAIHQLKKKKQQNESSDQPEQATDDDITSNETIDNLKALGVFPNSKLAQLNEKEFTGPFVASVILTHIDFYNRIHSVERFKQSSVHGSISFEFHHDSFEQLFYIIDQLTTTKSIDSNIIIHRIVSVCLRLFTVHLKFLCNATPTLDRDLLSKSDEWKEIVQTSASKSIDNIDFSKFSNENQVKLWFDRLLKLTNHENPEQQILCQEASKALICITNKKVLSFTEKLSFYHKSIIENQYPVFIKEILLELKKDVNLLSWIELLVNDNVNQSEKSVVSTVLYSFVDICFTSSNDIDLNEQLKQILLKFQELLLIRLMSPSRIEETILKNDKTQNESDDYSVSLSFISFITNYLTYILNSCTDNEFLNSIFVGLCLMTKDESTFTFNIIQPIFTTLLPKLLEYLFINHKNEISSLYSICWLIGKMSNKMIIGSEENSFELKHEDKLKSLLFAGGCEQIIVENNKYLLDLCKSNLYTYSQFELNNQSLSSFDKEFLMSVYNNTDEGARLISKMKEHMNEKQQLLKSIEQQANDACAFLFAVYIKHYRRIDLAKRELLRTNDKKPHDKLLSIYEYANDVKILFATTKAQGGDVDELYQQIKMNTLFLILNVKETNVIPIIKENEDLPSTPTLINTQPRKRISFQRQISRWTKAKAVLRLLRNTIQACIRFKKLILTKKQVKENHSIESNLNRLIDAFVYGNFYKNTTPIINEEEKLELDELSQCLSRYHERAMTRLITYRFIQKFIENLFKIDNQDFTITVLNLYLPHLKSLNGEWSYLEKIQATNHQLKDEISYIYYSIIRTIFEFVVKLNTLETKLLAQNMFNMLNLSYESIDLINLSHDKFIEKIFKSFVSFVNESDSQIVTLDLRLTAYNWFRFYVFKLCENIELDKMKSTTNKIVEKQQNFIFNILILNELKSLKNLKESLPDDIDQTNSSLNNAAIDWFIKAATMIENNSIKFSSKFDVELYTNQLLVVLLRCIYLYDNVRLICANIDFIEELLFIFRNSKSHVSISLTLKILRYIISLLPESEAAIILMKNLSEEFLLSIGNNATKNDIAAETRNELINIYRTIMFSKSPWQSIAIEHVFNNIISFVNESNKTTLLKDIDTMELNRIFASLSILGGYIPSYCLGSIVNVYPNEESNEFDLAIIIDINTEDQDSDSAEVLPYSIQYLHTDKTEWVSAEKLRIQIDMLPSDLFVSTNIDDFNTMIHSLLDALGRLIQIDTSTTESLVLLELKRRSMLTLDYLLNDKKLAEIFIEKSYLSLIAQLSIYDSSLKNRSLPADLRLFNQIHLEQYCLSLDKCLETNQIIENESEHIIPIDVQEIIIIQNPNETSFTIWNPNEFKQSPLIVESLSITALEYNGWKPYASKSEIESYKNGRIGEKDISITSLPVGIINPTIYDKCGTKHRFPGRAHLTTGRLAGIFPTIIVDDLQLTEGNWYYCVRLPLAGIVQIGWATTGFKPNPLNGRGVGDDEYSWSYDGSRKTLYNKSEFQLSSEKVVWEKNDVCGCGIEINGENTRITYWLNGKCLGTFFEHEVNIGTSTTKCNFLPHGHVTSFFPAVSLNVSWLSLSSIEFIFSPEDMEKCPLPNGYKPLLAPQSINIENSIVPYPYSAYLVNHNDIQDYIPKKRSANTMNVLYDLINECHLTTSYSLDNDGHLLLPENNNGFSLSIDNQSLTLSFDVEVLSQVQNEQTDIILFTLDTKDTFCVKIPLDKFDKTIQAAIVIYSKEQKIKIYLNDQCRTIETNFEIQTMTDLSFHILPNINARIKNIGIWKYALEEEYILRLFTYNLSYVAIDYKQMQEYRKQVNTFSFNKNQQHFENELLLPFNEPYDAELWEKKKNEIDNNEFQYFKNLDETNESTIQLFGNKTYLVLSKSIEEWSEYTLIFDISVSNLPPTNEHLTIFSLNKKSGIYITPSGKICLFNDGNINQSKMILKLNEYIRLLIMVHKKYIEIYLNGTLQIRSNIGNDQFVLKTNRIHVFEEIDLEMNTTKNDTVRIECKSITFLNRLIESEWIDKEMKLPNYPLVNLVQLPYSLIAPNLIAIGYKSEWIKLTIKKYNTTNSQVIDTIILENKDEFLKYDDQDNRKHHWNILSRLNPSIELRQITDVDNDDEIKRIGQFICDDENSTELSRSYKHSTSIENADLKKADENQENKLEKEWYQRTVYGLDVPNNIARWMNDKSSKVNSDNLYQLLNLKEPEQKFEIEIFDRRKIISSKSIQYSHQEISRSQYFNSRVACEHGLISIYARNIILKMLKVWSSNASNLSQLEKFGDYPFIVKLLRLLDNHYEYRSTYRDENIDQTITLIHSILQFEMKGLIQQMTINEDIDIKTLQSKTPLLYELQKDIIIQWIRYALKPSSVFCESNNEESLIIDEKTIVKQPNLHFIFKMLNVFVQLTTDKCMKQNEISSLVSILFRKSFINLMFDVFLLIPDYQSKIFILRLFVTLIRRNKTINLSVQSQDFLVHLLIEFLISTISKINPMERALQTVVMDLVFLFLQRQLTQNMITTEQSYYKVELSKLPTKYRDLLTVISMISALIDKNKQQQYLNEFLEELHNLISQALKLNNDDIEISYTMFDIGADLQLISLMNEHPSMENSFDEFLAALPSESSSDITLYKNYPLLLNISHKYIRVRATIFYQFNKLVDKIVSMLDLSLLPGQSILVDYIRTAKHYLLQTKKNEWLGASLSATEHESISEVPEVKFDTIKASTNDNEGINTMFSQAFEQLHENAHIIFRLENERLWLAKYLDMHSIDQGGPYRDSITAICLDICSTCLSLFVLCPNGQTNTGLNRDCWIPNVFPQNKPIPKKFKKQYQFIGQLIGMAIRKKHYLNVKFASLVWKQLVGEDITMKDIEAIDIQCLAILKEMEINIEQNQSIDTDSDIDYLCTSIMSELRFDVVSSSGQTYELIPGGQDISVTPRNFPEYCTRYREYRLKEFHRQIEYIRQGLCSVIPYDLLTLFTANELEEAVCGKSEIDVSLLKRNTKYHGSYNENSPHIQRFWTVLSEMFDEAQRKLFLIFVWGRSTLPRLDKDFESKFIIQTISGNNSNETDLMLPRSHTCFFALDLPEYSTTEIMYERLNYAITNCSSIDGDGVAENNANLANLNDGAVFMEQLPAIFATLLGSTALT